jgi:DMSO/TMAO reductase YedYZ heme-binding membrane subunit
LESSVVIMLLVSFCLAGVIILKKEAIPERIRAPLALIAVILVLASFAMLVVSLMTMGAP